jgi:hypothetical protein
LIEELLEFANHHFALTKPNRRTGHTLLKELQDIAIQTGEISPKLLSAPRLPVFTAHIWSWFCDLGRSRRMGFSALESISWTEIQAYFRLMELRPQQWELMAIVMLDDAFMRSRAAADQAATAKEVFGKVKNG